MVVPEDKVLHLLSKDGGSSAGSDDWPEFTLRNVRIWDQADRQPTSLFVAHPTRRLIIEGNLDKVEPSLRHVVKNSRYHHETLRIRDVTVYSFSEDEDGTLGFWAAGRAGWYELRAPAKSHESIFRGMNEATGMFYYLADKYRTVGPRPSRDTVKDTERLAKYAIANYVNSDYSQRRDGEDALEGFCEHRRFLLRCMLEEQEGLEWEGAAIFRYLRRQYPDDFKDMEALVASNETPATESESEMQLDPPRKSKATRQTSAELATPKQRGTKRHSAENDSDASSGELESAVRTQTRSVLRPHGSKSAKKYARHLAATNPSTNTADTQADAEECDESDEEVVAQDTPSKQAYLAGLRGGKPAAHVSKESDTATTVKPTIRAAYYKNIGAGDIWTCPYDGCNERVYDAHSAVAIRLMEEHFSAKHADPMTDLIKAEMRPYNKVGHLLSRVKDLASIQSLIYDGAGGEDIVDVEAEVGMLRQY